MINNRLWVDGAKFERNDNLEEGADTESTWSCDQTGPAYCEAFAVTKNEMLIDCPLVQDHNHGLDVVDMIVAEVIEKVEGNGKKVPEVFNRVRKEWMEKLEGQNKEVNLLVV